MPPNDTETDLRSRDDDRLVDVLVVGAGPVGLALAGDLARRGVDVWIVDALPAPTSESRAIVLHSRTLDHLEAHGVLPEIMKRGIVSTGMEFHSGGESIATLSFESIDAVHRHSVSLLQTDTEAVLAGRLAQLGVVVERSTTFTGYQQTDDDVAAAVTDRDGVSRTIRARYLVGADGARSAVRHAMGERLEGDFVGEDFLLADVDGDHPYEPSHFHTFLSTGDTTVLVFPLPAGRVRVMAQLPPGTDPDRAVTQEWAQQALDDRGVDLRIRSAHWLARFRLKHGQVARYRVGRVFLAGDAAHIHSPAGGLGMNTGIQDAMNLGWKLAAAVHGHGDDALLDSYQAERRPVAAEVIAFSTRISTMGTIKNPVAQHIRNAVVRFGFALPVVQDRLAEKVEEQRVRYLGSPIVGGGGHAIRPGDFLHLHDSPVAAALARTTGHLVIALRPTTERGDAEAAALPVGVVPLDISDDDRDRLVDATGLRGGGVVIVRPDGYVGFIGPVTDAAGALRYDVLSASRSAADPSPADT
ncbi:FAD-dependent monooxygenase [Leifsonia sp. 2MCAF36]|uniref:FAD-dependent monooxygenase n=1 Tax=Leifsonia sp. 2MCAF36 TaxID=3232988 RepID=UPI003F94D407